MPTHRDSVRLAALRLLLRAVLTAAPAAQPPPIPEAVILAADDLRDICAALRCSTDDAVALLARVAAGAG